MSLFSRDTAPGLGEALAVWALFGLDAATILVINARARELQPEQSGVHAGFGTRPLGIFLMHPVAPAAVPLALLTGARLPRDHVASASRLSAFAAIGAATLVMIPANRRQERPSASLAGATALVTFAAGVTSAAMNARGSGGFAPWQRGDRARLALGLGLAGVSLPWLLADAGIYVGDVPLIGRLFLSRDRLPAGAPDAAVHLGHHHGLDGALLVWTALALSRQLGSVRTRSIHDPLAIILAVALVYGLGRAAEDAWYEQIVKRGWMDIRLPDLVKDGRLVGWRSWLGVVAISAVLARRWMGPRPRWPRPRLAFVFRMSG